MTVALASMALCASQGVGLTNDEKPAAQIIAEMMADASAILSRLVHD